MNKNLDLLYQLEKMPLVQEQKEQMFKDTIYYQQKFGFGKSSDPAHSTWNNEADAFKHAYMQAWLTYLYNTTIAKKLGGLHERNGNLYMGQSAGEENMDLWNNDRSRQIGQFIKDSLKEYKHYLTERNIKDIFNKGAGNCRRLYST